MGSFEAKDNCYLTLGDNQQIVLIIMLNALLKHLWLASPGNWTLHLMVSRSHPAWPFSQFYLNWGRRKKEEEIKKNHVMSAKFCILDMKIMLELHYITFFMFQLLLVILILKYISHLISSPTDFI